jgi:hypothetical protein
MSFGSDLYAGDADRIAALFEGQAGELLDHDTSVKTHLHLPGILHGEMPGSIDTMTAIACEVLSLPDLTFKEHAHHVAGADDPTEADYGAYVMGDGWIEVMATIQPQHVRAIAVKWLAEIEADVSEADRIRELALLVDGTAKACRVAREHRVQVVYTWRL